MHDPNFIVVGAMKAATTTLKNILIAHPQVFMASDEIHFFNNNRNYAKGLEWYRAHFEPETSHRAVGEKTPGYHYAPNVPERIARHYPAVKLIWILRNPIRRAYSNYWYNVSRGWEGRSFSKAVKSEITGKEQDPFRLYLRRGVYHEQILRYLEVFPREQMFITFFEELVASRDSFSNRIFSFLQVDPFELDRGGKSRDNVTWIPRSRPAQRLSYRLGIQGSNFPRRLFNWVNLRRSPGYPPMGEAMAQRLAEYFAEPNEALAALLKQPLDLWDPAAKIAASRPSRA